MQCKKDSTTLHAQWMLVEMCFLQQWKIVDCFSGSWILNGTTVILLNSSDFVGNTRGRVLVFWPVFRSRIFIGCIPWLWGRLTVHVGASCRHFFLGSNVFRSDVYTYLHIFEYSLQQIVYFYLMVIDHSSEDILAVKCLLTPKMCSFRVPFACRQWKRILFWRYCRFGL